MNAIIKQLYLDSFRQLKRGNYRGFVSNAKPYLLISIINAVSKAEIKDNRILIDEIAPIYKEICIRFSPETKPTPLSYPYYHLGAEPFYHLKWKSTPIKKDAPSGKFVRDNVEYAYLDNELWELLQDEGIRNEFRSVIDDYYLK